MSLNAGEFVDGFFCAGLVGGGGGGAEGWGWTGWGGTGGYIKYVPGGASRQKAVRSSRRKAWTPVKLRWVRRWH